MKDYDLVVSDQSQLQSSGRVSRGADRRKEIFPSRGKNLASLKDLLVLSRSTPLSESLLSHNSPAKPLHLEYVTAATLGRRRHAETRPTERPDGEGMAQTKQHQSTPRAGTDRIVFGHRSLSRPSCLSAESDEAEAQRAEETRFRGGQVVPEPGGDRVVEE